MSQSGPSENRWIVRRRNGPDPRLRLLCLPYAGGGSVMYHPWSRDFPAEIEVCAVEPPGRLTRRNEPLLESVPALVEPLATATEELFDRPFALFGYSLGALVAFELARSLQRRGGPAPVVLIVAACLPPHLVNRRRVGFSRLPEPRFMQEVEARYGALDPLVRNEPEMLKLVLDVLRADLRMVEDYEFRDHPKLTCPIAVVGGSEDVTVDPANLPAWSEHTTAACQVKLLQGGHFFLRNCAAELREIVVSELRPRPGPHSSGLEARMHD